MLNKKLTYKNCCHNPYNIGKYACKNCVSKFFDTNSDKLGNLAPEEFLMKGVSKIGIQADSIENQGTSQESISKSIEDRLMSETSVDLNEELTDMIKYQRSYQASARVFNTCCDILNTLVQLGA